MEDAAPLRDDAPFGALFFADGLLFLRGALRREEGNAEPTLVDATFSCTVWATSLAASTVDDGISGLPCADRSPMVAKARALPAYRPMPILFNEDDHFDFEQPLNNFTAALSVYASWGYFDPGQSNYIDGYQCPPVNWGINTDRKRAFFRLVREVTRGSRE